MRKINNIEITPRIVRVFRNTQSSETMLYDESGILLAPIREDDQGNIIITGEFTEIGEVVFNKGTAPFIKYKEGFSSGIDAVDYTPAEYNEIEITNLKRYKMSEIANARWTQEVGGVMFRGVKMHTDRDSQSKYTAMAVTINVSDVPFQPFDWKGIDGWLFVDTPQTMVQLAEAVQTHVATAYAKEKVLNDRLSTATTVEQVEAIKWDI